VASTGSTDVYSKVLSGSGQRAVVLLNRGDSPTQVTVNLSDASLRGPVSVRDLRARADRGTFTGSYTATVPAHGTAFLRLHGTDLVPGQDLGGPASASPALVRFDNTDALAFTRGQNGALQEQTLTGNTWPGSWTDLGGQILGQPVAYGSEGGRVDVFVRGTDNAAYQRTLRNGQWGQWVNLGGAISDAPSVAFTSPTQWTLFARGLDGLVWMRDNGSGWSGLGAPNNGAIYGRPGAAVDSAGTTFLAVRTAQDNVWVRTRDAGGTWSGWTSLGGVVSGSPTLVSTLGRVYLFERAGDYTLWQVNYVNGAWGSWFKRTEFPSNSLVGAVGAAAGDNGSAWVAVRGPDDRIYQTTL
jgi:alpha-galactosidase